MTLNAGLDIVIGLVLMYLTLSLACTVLNEMIASVFRLRAATLARSIAGLIDDPKLKSAFDDHGLIDGAKAASGGHSPSYLPGKTFALALLGSLDLDPSKPLPTLSDIRDAVLKLPASNIRDVLLSELTVAGADLDKVRDGLARWFDNSMDRVSGVYKRNIKRITFGVGVVLALSMNADTLSVTGSLWRDGTLRDAITRNAADIDKFLPGGTAAAGKDPSLDSVVKKLDLLRPMPLGWEPCSSKCTKAGDTYKFWFGQWSWKKIAGLLITALAISLGAPFWFDVLSKLVNLRTTGIKPKRTDETPA
jgi:hypothetical protein